MSKDTVMVRAFKAVCVSIAAVMIIVLIILCSGVIAVRNVSGSSMQPLYHSGDKVLVVKCERYTRGDVIIFNTETDGTYIKRIIAVGGDKIEIENGAVYLNDRELYEDYLIAQYTDNADMYTSIIVPDGEVFVLGDNRDVSMDSRHKEVGTVPVSSIIGRAVYKFELFE